MSGDIVNYAEPEVQSMTKNGRGSDRAYVGRGSNRRLVSADAVKVSQGASFYCPACGSEMHHNRGNANRIACFKHNGSVPQEVKDQCPIYSGAVSSEAYGEEQASRITVALQVARGNDPRWSFHLRLPRTEDIRETVVVKVESVRKAVRLTGFHAYEDVQVTPRRAKYVVEKGQYTLRLRRTDFDARNQGAFVFPVRASETSARSRRLFWGLSYYVLTDASTQLPLESTRVSPLVSTKEYNQWKCLRITLPDIVDTNVEQWFLKAADAFIESAPYETRPLFGTIGERRVTGCFGETQYVSAMREHHTRDNESWLMVSKDVTEKQTSYLLDSRLSIVAIKSSDFCALGIASSEDDNAWPLSLNIEAMTWFEPTLPVAVFLQDGAQIVCTLGDAQSAELLASVSRRIISFECVRPNKFSAVVEYKAVDAFDWKRQDFLMEQESECQQFVAAVNLLLHSAKYDALLTIDGIGSFRLIGARVPQKQSCRVTSGTSCGTWALHVALRKRAGAYSYTSNLREGSWPNR